MNDLTRFLKPEDRPGAQLLLESNPIRTLIVWKWIQRCKSLHGSSILIESFEMEGDRFVVSLLTEDGAISHSAIDLELSEARREVDTMLDAVEVRVIDDRR